MIDQILLITIGIIFGLATFIVVLMKPILGLALTFASLPLYIFTGFQGVTFTSVAGLLGGITLVSYLVHFLPGVSSIKKTSKEELTTNKAIYAFSVLFFIEVFLWDLFVPIRVDRFYSLTVIQLLILVWLSNQIIQEQKQLETLMKIFILVNVIVLAFYLPNFDYFSPDASLDRIAGFAGNANEFSVYLGISILFLLYFFEKSRKTLTKTFLLLLVLFIFIPIFMSGSRGGLLFLVIALGYQIIRTRKPSLLLITILFLLIIINSSLVPRVYIERMLNIPSDIMTQSDTIGTRFNLWRHALNLWQTSPFIGIGTGMFLIRSTEGTVYTGTKMLVAHNSYVSTLVENGLIGLILFGAVNFLSFLNFEKAIRLTKSTNPQLHKLAITWQSVLLIYMLNGVKGNYQFGKILWLAIGVSMVMLNFSCQAIKKDTTESQYLTIQEVK